MLLLDFSVQGRNISGTKQNTRKKCHYTPCIGLYFLAKKKKNALVILYFRGTALICINAVDNITGFITVNLLHLQRSLYKMLG